MLEAALEGAIDRAVAHVREVQHREGYWFGFWRLFSLNYSYALGLLQCGVSPTDSRLQDICDQIEGCARADGGISFTPEAPSTNRWTTSGVFLLRRCRPASRVLAPAQQFLTRTGHVPNYPHIVLERWLLEEEARPTLFDYQPPPAALRRLAWKVAPHVLIPPKKPMLPPGPLARRTFERLVHWLSWPLPDDLLRNVEKLPIPFTVPMYLSFLAVQLLARGKPLAEGHRTTEKIVPSMIDQYLFDDGAIYYLNALLPTLVCLRELGRLEDEARVRSAVEKIEYRPGGWLRTCMGGMNVFDTGITIQGLRAVGVPDSDPAMVRALAFLRRAQREDGLWSWAWDPDQGARQRFGDTDDTSTAVLALTGGGGDAPRRERTIAAYRRLSAESGGMKTFDFPSDGYNPPTPSNTSRSIQAMLALGVDGGDPVVARAVHWLAGCQKKDGSWYDFWLQDAMYGTALAAEGLVKSKAHPIGDPAIERAIHFIVRTQNRDGGWGYDWYGRPRSTSVVEHTSFAIYALATLTRERARPMAALGHGVKFLVDTQREDGNWEPTTVGQWDGMEGYASTIFPVVFALKALGAYRALRSTHLDASPRLVRTQRLAEAARARNGAQ